MNAPDAPAVGASPFATLPRLAPTIPDAGKRVTLAPLAGSADALALATENRELGEWLAQERAFDATFANALSSVTLPETLREDILGCLAGERGEVPRIALAHQLKVGDFFGAEEATGPVRIEKYYEAIMVATEAIRFAENRVGQ